MILFFYSEIHIKLIDIINLFIGVIFNGSTLHRVHELQRMADNSRNYNCTTVTDIDLVSQKGHKSKSPDYSFGKTLTGQ